MAPVLYHEAVCIVCVRRVEEAVRRACGWLLRRETHKSRYDDVNVCVVKAGVFGGLGRTRSAAGRGGATVGGIDGCTNATLAPKMVQTRSEFSLASQSLR